MIEAKVDFLENEQKKMIGKLYALEVAKLSIQNTSDVYRHIAIDNIKELVEKELNKC